MSKKNQNGFTRIIPADKEEKFLFAFSFKVSTAGVQKRGTPSNDPKALNSCKGWAGQLCGLSPEQEAYFAELERLQIAEENCEKDYKKKLVSGFIGQTSRWDSVEKKCIQPVCLYKGEVVSCNGGIENARERELGEECTEWAKNQKSKNNFTYISPASGETTVACGDQRFWFHTGSEWNEPDKWYEKACEYNYQKDRLKTEGEYKYNPVKSEGVQTWDKIGYVMVTRLNIQNIKIHAELLLLLSSSSSSSSNMYPFLSHQFVITICLNGLIKNVCWNRR